MAVDEYDLPPDEYVWITVGDKSVRIADLEVGVGIKVFDLDKENQDPKLDKIVYFGDNMDLQDKILEEVKAERDRQDSFFGPTSDDLNTIRDWTAFITTYAGRAAYHNTRLDLVKVAALAVAAIEAFDRNGAWPMPAVPTIPAK